MKVAKIEKEMLKRRLTYNDKRVYIKCLGSNIAIVSHHEENDYKQFKVNIKDLVEFK
tara:strand:- start:18 stop:188 length:171 start_codon:yes stop_codon:yes gene_type:complete